MSNTPAFEQAADIEAATPINSPPAPASELPSGPGIELPNHWGHWRKDGWGEIWVKDDGHWAVMEYDHRVLGTYHSPDDLPQGGWLPLADASEVERLNDECDRLQCERNAAQSALAAAERELARLKELNAALHDDDIVGMHARALTAERERDEWKRQHDRVLSQAQKDFDRAAMADTYEQWLLDLGRISGCGHVDERLPRCIEEAFAKEQERATAAEQRLAEVEGALKGASTVWKEADDERLSEHRARQDEAEKWKAEGDMYGWNFHQGMASGMTSASIIFARVKRFIDTALAKEKSDA